jgi:hypothetical protein
MPLIDMNLSTNTYLANVDSTMINKDIIIQLNSVDLFVPNVSLFYSAPRYMSNIAHVDGSPHKLASEWPSKCKLNYVIGEANTTWYDATPELRRNASLTKTVIGNPYQSFNKTELSIMLTTVLSGWHLFEAGVPHNVSNTTDKPRWCISMPLFKIGTSEHETLQRCKEKLTAIEF